MLAKIHIAKRDLGLDDARYRALLMQVTGKDSCKYMTYEELDKVLRVLYGLGFIPIQKKTIIELKADKEGMIYNITNLASLVMGNKWKRRIRGYIKKKFGVDDLRFLDAKQLINVFGFVRAIQKRTEPF